MHWKSCLLLACLLFGAPFSAADDAQRPPIGAYALVTDQSIVRIQVFRDGILKLAGHNHVIGLRALQGLILVSDTVAESSLALEFSATDLTVDLPQDRSHGGQEFQSPIDEPSRASTRKNMLGPSLLDAARYPQIKIRSVALRGTFEQLSVDALVSLAGMDNIVTIPVMVSYAEEQITARGKISLRHEQLGLAPFEVLLGALSVRDEMLFEFEILARLLEADQAVNPL